MTAIVISRWSGKNVAYALPIPDGVLSADPNEILEWVFRQTNAVDGTEFITKERIQVPSTTAGDLVILASLDGDRYFHCAPNGWQQITLIQAVAIQKGDFR